MNEILIYSITLSIFISYILFVMIRFGILPSISDSYYKIKAKPLFTFFLWSVAIGAILLGDSILMFLAGSGIVFVGAAAAFRQRITKTVHVIGAVSGIVFSQLEIIINYQMWWVTFIFASLAWVLHSNKIKNKTWWIEILAFVSVFYILYLSLNK